MLSELMDKLAQGNPLNALERSQLMNEMRAVEEVKNLAKGWVVPGTQTPIFQPPMSVIYSKTLEQDTASLTIPVPSDYKHLFFIGGGRTALADTADLMTIQFNGDTGSNYRHTGDGVSNNSQTHYQNLNYTSIICGNWASATADADTMGSFFCFLPHTRGRFWKSSISIRGVHATAAQGMTSMLDYGMWENTAPITSIKIFPDSLSNILEGSSFTLFGLV